MIQNDWIKKLESFNDNNKPILTTKWYTNPDGQIGLGRWVPLSNNPAVVDEVTILPNEIVFDIDFKDFKYVKQYGKRIVMHLSQKGIPYIIGMTGGKGVHIHVYLNVKIPAELSAELLDAKQHGYSMRQLRMSIWRSILNEVKVDSNLIGRGKSFDEAVVNYDDNSKGHMIRCFGGRKPQKIDEVGNSTYAYKYRVDDIPDKNYKIKDMKDVTYPDRIIPWTIPVGLIKKSIQSFLKSIKIPTKQRVIQKYQGLYTTLPCIQYGIDNGSEEGKRHDAASLIAIACALDNIDDKNTMDLLQAYHKSCHDLGGSSQFSVKELKGWVNWLKKRPITTIYWDKGATCTRAKKLGFADDNACTNCPLNKSVHKDSIDFLSRADIIDELQKEFSKIIVNEKENRIILFFSYLSSYMQHRIHPQLLGASATGKSFLMNNVLEYIPEEDILSKLTGASAKSFNYYLTQNKNLETITINGIEAPNLDGKIIVVQEFEGAQDAIITLRPLMSGDQAGIKNITVEKDSQGRNNFKEMIAHGRPLFCCATTNFELDKEFITRTWGLELDESLEQTKEIMQFEADEDIDPGCHKSEKIELIQDCIRLLKTQGNKVINPYSKLLAAKMPIGDDPMFIRLRRDFKKIKGFIKICAWLHQFQRPKIKIDEEIHILATLEDYNIVSKLIEPSFDLIFTGNDTMKKGFKVCIELDNNLKHDPEYEGITSRMLAKKTGWNTNKSREVLKKLENKNFLLLRFGGKKGREHKYEIRSKDQPVFPRLDISDLKMHYNELLNTKPKVAEMLKKVMEDEYENKN